MASAVVGALRVVLSLDSAEFDTAMKRVSSSAKEWGNDLTNIGRQATAVGSALTRTLTLPLVGLGLAAVKSASDFESSFAGVRKTVEATEPEFAALAQGLRDMAKEIPVNVNELNKVAEAAGQLGIKKGDILAFTRTMADLGVTTNLTADQAATATAQIQNIFGAAGKDVDRFGSTLVALGNAGASTEKDIIDMGLRIAGAGHQVGLTQAQVLSFASALSSVGINAEAGGSAISRVFLKINDAVAKGGSGMAEFARVSGMTAGQFKQAWEKDAATATTAFITGLGRLKAEGENVNATIEGLVGKNIILKDTLMRASGAGTLLTEQLALGNKAWKENTALTEEAGKRYETFQSQLTILWNKLQDVAITLGTAMLPMLKAATAALADLTPVLERMAKGFADLPAPIQMIVVGFWALVAAAGPAIWVIGQLITSVGVLTKAFAANGIAMRAMTVSYAPIAAGLTAIAGSFVTIGALAVGLVASLVAVGQATVDLYRHWKDGGSLWAFLSQKDDDNFVRRWLGLSAGIRTTDIALSGVADSAAAAVPPIERVAGAATKSKEELKEADKAVKQFAASLKSLGGRDALAGAEEVVKQLGALGGPLNVLPGKLEEMAGRLREAAQAALMMGKAGLSGEYSKLAATLSPVVQFQQRFNVTIGEYVTDAHTAADATSALFEQFYRLTGQIQKINPELLKSTLNLSAMFEPFKKGIEDSGTIEHFKKVKETVMTVADSLRDLSRAFAELSQISGGGFGKATEAIGQLVSSINLGTQASETMKAGISRLSGETKNLVAGFAQIATGAAAAAAAINQATQSANRAQASMQGAAAGAQAGSAFGPIGTIIGGAIGFFVGFERSSKKAREESAKLQGEITALQFKLTDLIGPTDDMEASLNKLGLTLEGVFSGDSNLTLANLTKLISEVERELGESAAAVELLNGELRTTQGELDGLVGKARDLGYEFGQNGEFIGVSFDAVKAKADEFGVSVDGLGPKFRQQGIDAEASKIINAFTLLSKAGGDVGGILVGMKDEIGKLVGDSIKFGTTIPKNMQPWIAELIRTDQLVDSNGNKITDLSLLKFGDPVATEFEKISIALREVVQKLQDILNQIAAIPTQRTLTVTAQYRDPGPPANFGDPGQGGDRNSPPPFATGTLGQLGSWFGNFPKTGMNAVLHGMEAVITPQQAPAFAMDVLSSMGGGMAPSASNDAVVEAIGRLERTLLMTIPAIAETSARHGAQTSGRRR